MLKSWDFERVHITNGLTLLYAHNPRLPLLSLNAFLKVGKDQNPMEGPGTASLTARLLDEGTDSFTHQQISEALETVIMLTMAVAELSLSVWLMLKRNSLPATRA